MPNTEVDDWPSRLNEEVLLRLLGSRSSGKNIGAPIQKSRDKNLRIYTTDSAPKKIRDDETVDELGRDLKVPVDAFGERIGDPGFWDHFKNEIKILICGKNRRYADIRKKLRGIGVGAEAGIAMSLATGPWRNVWSTCSTPNQLCCLGSDCDSAARD
jgi:hypothetical protein